MTSGPFIISGPEQGLVLRHRLVGNAFQLVAKHIQLSATYGILHLLRGSELSRRARSFSAHNKGGNLPEARHNTPNDDLVSSARLQ